MFEDKPVSARILADVATSITELKANPMKAVASGHGLPIAVLNRNEPAFYCVPADAYEQLLDKIEDMELLALARERANDPAVKVSLDGL
jgi:antitoxin StbD